MNKDIEIYKLNMNKNINNEPEKGSFGVLAIAE